MKKSLVLLTYSILLLAGTAYADKGDQYLIAKLGMMQIKVNNTDPLFSAGVYYGYGVTRDITAEAELNVGLAGGGYGSGNNTGEYGVWTLAGYGVYRFPITDAAYLKGKAGLLFESVKNAGRVDTNTTAAFGIAGGAGAGYVFSNRLTLEGEATLIDQDIIFWSLGVHYPF